MKTTKPTGKLKHAYETISKQEQKINDLKKALRGFLDIKDLIEYPLNTTEEHFGEALVITNAISNAEQILNPIK